MQPTGILETPLGSVNFTMTDADHVYLFTESRNDQVITIRGIPYHVSYHCHLIDGQWTVKDCHDPYLSRKDVFNKEPSWPARRAAREVLAKAWAEYLAAHPKLSRQAAQAKAHEEIERLKSDLADLKEQVTNKTAELADAKKHLAQL